MKHPEAKKPSTRPTARRAGDRHDPHIRVGSPRGGPLGEAKLGGRTVLVLGSEREGGSRPIEALATECV